MLDLRDFMDLIREAAKAKSNNRALLIVKANQMRQDMTPMQIEELADLAIKMDKNEFRTLQAVGIPRQIFQRVLLERARPK